MKQLTPQLVKTLMEARKSLQLGAFNQAEREILSILKVRPDFIEAQASLAFIYASTKQHSKATEQLKILLKANPSHAQTQLNLANSLYEQKLYDEAIKHYKAAMKLEPKLIDALINCSISYRMLKNHNAAIACLQRALDSDKTNARAFHVLGMVYVDIEDINRALHYLECAAGLADRKSVV